MNCCRHTKKSKRCLRKSDKKVFELPRRFSKKQCLGNIRGFSMKSSCAPYKDCRYKKNKTRKYVKKSNHKII